MIAVCLSSLLLPDKVNERDGVKIERIVLSRDGKNQDELNRLDRLEQSNRLLSKRRWSRVEEERKQEVASSSVKTQILSRHTLQPLPEAYLVLGIYRKYCKMNNDAKSFKLTDRRVSFA